MDTQTTPSIWASLKITLNAIFSTIVTTATTVESTVKLVENEIGGLGQLQHIRFDAIKAERDQQRKLLKST
jgi:hypothetical protein